MTAETYRKRAGLARRACTPQGVRRAATPTVYRMNKPMTFIAMNDGNSKALTYRLRLRLFLAIRRAPAFLAFFALLDDNLQKQEKQESCLRSKTKVSAVHGMGVDFYI